MRGKIAHKPLEPLHKQAVAAEAPSGVRNEGELRGTPPSGKRVTITGTTIVRYASGKAAEAWYEYDALGMLQQIGAIPTPEQVG